MKKIIKLGACEIYPYQYYSKENVIIGLNYDIVIESLRLQDYEVLMILYKDKTKAYADMRESKIDGILEIKENLYGKESVTNSNLVLNSRVDVVSLDNLIISNINEVETKNLKLGYIKNFEPHNFMQNSYTFNKLYEYFKYIDLINDLINKKIDIGLIDSRLSKTLYKDVLYNEQKVISNFSINFDSKIIFREDNLLKKDIFNIGLKKLIDTNQYFEIIKHWENNIDI